MINGGDLFYYQDRTVQTMPMTRLESKGAARERDLQQPPTAVTMIWATSRKTAAQIASAVAGFDG
jgi:hypothetical protein